MEMKIKSQVQFNDDLSQRSNIVSGDSLSNSFAKIHHDLNDYEIAANIAANDRPKNLLYIHDILSDSVSTATEEILGYPLDAGTYVYSAEIYTVQNPSVANVTKIEFLGSDGNTVVGTCNIACDTKKEEHINVTLSDEAYYIKYYRDTYSSETVGYLKTSKQMICLPNVYAAFPEYTMYAPSLGETFLEVEDSVKTYDVQDTYDSSSYKAISGKGVAAALGTLDVLSVGGSGKYISEIREEDGKIAATPTTFDTALSSSSTNNNAPTSKAVYDDQQRQEAEIGAVANAGAKNIADFNFGGVVQNVNVKPGTIVCVESNGTFSFSGTSADKNYAAYVLKQFLLKAGAYKISGVSDGSNTKYWMRIGTGTADTVLFNLYDAEREFNLVSDTLITVQVVIYKKQTVSNLVFKPMIRPAAITDPTFVPYAKTNVELTVAEDEDRAALIQQVDSGAKNFLDTYVSTLKKYNTASSAVWNGSSYTQNGITYSVNSDGTISVSGTATSTSFLVLANRTYLNTKITRGRYSISGCPTGGGSSGATYRIFCLNPNANISNGYTDTGNGYIGEFYYDDSKDCNIAIGVGTGCVITDPVVFKPMLCTAADWAVSQKFVPYRPSWQEMAEKTSQIGLKLVKSQTVTSNTEVTYAMDKNDFLESSPNIEGSIGTYVISVMPWSTTPTFSLYTVSYTGGSFAYTSIVKIAGTDRTVTVSNGVISISGFPSAGAKVSIHAML